MKRSRKYIEWQLSRPLSRGAEKMRKQKEKEKQEMLSRDVIKRNFNGELEPINTDDLLLGKACGMYNKHLREAKAFVENAMNPNGFLPIQKGLSGYYALKKANKYFSQWCSAENEKIRKIFDKGEINNG